MSAFGNPQTQVAFSVFENKGVFAMLLGSGLSRAAEIPTGWEITTDLVRRIATAEGVEEQADWAQWYRDKHGEEPDYSALLDALSSTPAERRQIIHSYIEPNEEDREEGRKVPTAGHKAIAQLVRNGFIRIIVTTNFDRLMENALREVGVEPTIVSSPDALKGAEPLAHTACYILKLHGDYKDARILNTEEELGVYPNEYDALLDRIIDEYGLIVCGWSGEWDAALRAAILRASNRRYPLFWATRGALKGRGKELCDHRRGIEVPIPDADWFFSGLADQVRTLAETQRKNPAEIAFLISRTKRYLAKLEYRIQLSDLIDGEVQKIIDRLNEADMAPDGHVTPELFKKRVDVYQSVGEGLVKVCGLIGVWGDVSHLRLAADAIRNLWTTLQTPRGGTVVYLGMRGYIPLLAAHALSLGLIKSSRWKEYRDFLRVEIPGENNAEGTISSDVTSLLWRGNDKNLWNLLYDQRNRHAPLSDHLHDYLAVASRDYLGVTPDFTGLYLLSEALPALASIDGHSLKDLMDKLSEEAGNQKGHYWMPVWGRLGWDRWPVKRLLERLETEKFAKELSDAGFGGGNIAIVKATVVHLRRALASVHWY